MRAARNLSLAQDPEDRDDPHALHWHEAMLSINRVASGEAAAEAIDLLGADYSGCPRFQWKPLDDLYGPLLPGTSHIWGARTGGGKTMFVQNNQIAWLEAGIPHLICSTETKRARWLQLLAAIRQGIEPRHVLRNQWDRLAADSRDRIEAEIERLVEDPYGALWRILDEPRPTRGWWTALLKLAAKHDIKIIVFDHMLRMREHAPGPDQQRELSETMKLTTDIARDTGLVVILVHQLSRPDRGDRLAAHRQPDLGSLKSSGEIEQDADGVLLLWSPLSANLSRKEMADFTLGKRAVADMVEKNTIAVSVGKDRVGGAASVGHVVKLSVHAGRLGVIERGPEPALFDTSVGDRRTRSYAPRTDPSEAYR